MLATQSYIENVFNKSLIEIQDLEFSWQEYCVGHQIGVADRP